MIDQQPWLHWTSAARIHELHSRGLQEFGGRSGPPDAATCVDGALGGASNAEAYLEGEKHAKPGLVFAGYLLFSLVQRHCFMDGNKRVGWAAALDVLACLGLGIIATEQEAFDLVDDVIAHRIQTGEDVAKWMAPRLYARDWPPPA
jgi:death-on-curing protein